MRLVGAVFALELAFIALYSIWPESKGEAIFALLVGALVGIGVWA